MKIEKLAAAEGMPGYFPPGAVKTEGGFHICTMAEGENVSLAYLKRREGRKNRGFFLFPKVQDLEICGQSVCWAEILQGFPIP